MTSDFLTVELVPHYIGTIRWFHLYLSMIPLKIRIIGREVSLIVHMPQLLKSTDISKKLEIHYARLEGQGKRLVSKTGRPEKDCGTHG